MLTSTTAISIFRRDLTVGALLRGALALTAAGCVALSALPVNKSIDGTVLLMGVAVLWLVLSYRSVKGQRLIAESPTLIAAGQLDDAERLIEQALRSFSMFRASKVLSLHHLALLRHVQRNWGDAAELCRTLLAERPGTIRGISRTTRLLLADSLLHLGDLPGAYTTIHSLHTEKLSLSEAANLLLIQLDYESRVGAWQSMLPRGSIYQRLQLAELMPPPAAAAAQALMALAAKNLGRHDWSAWLKTRAELLADVDELILERPALKALWPEQPKL